ncbi:MAG: DUF11 domain-containing protein, partial [Deltaproteobacteria bacterium]|nr:DUF11 domain-containing protein [Deltaproteobacteria bacterium]
SADTIAWWENTAGDGSAWTERTVSAAFDGANSVYAADVDADGDTDVLGTAGGADTIAWWENTAGDGSAWTEHTVSAAFDGALSVYAADLDSDGDLDVAGAAATAGTITWWENTAGDGTAWTEHAVAGGFTGAYAVIAADVDSDGDLDVAGAAQNIDTIAWWENRGGQFALPTTDTAPTVLGDGQIDDLLAIAATHRGRGGDHDLELVTFELVFQKAAGDPLSSAEANAVIENLFIYRDDPLGADPGNFDPADPLVSTIATLTVSGSGLQVVSFIDGDPNLQVAFGTPRSYFAAVELTATAAAQVPNSFRITHLTETTSAGEDRDFDIPLDLEYAVNTSSGIVLAVPRPGFSKSFGPNPIFAAGVSTLVLVIDNLASAFAVTGLDFTDALPPDLVVATPANAATTCTGGVLTATPGTGVIAYTGGTVAASATCAVSVDVTTTVVGTHLNTSGALTSMLGSSGPAADALVVNPLADLVITKGDAPDPVVAGTGVSYTLTITNNGPSDATGVMASDTLPAGLSFVSAPGCAAAGGLVICMIGNMAAGDGIALTINATVDPGVTGTITNLAGVTGNETDPNLPNTVTETTAVVAETDLTVTKGDSPDPVAAGTVLTYTLTVANQGPSDATGVVATDTLPPEVSFVSAAAGCAAAGGVVTCTIGNLAAGGSAALTLNAAVDPAVTGTITNTAGVTGNETDPNLPNTVVETTAVVAEADLVVTKSDLVDPVTAGGSVRWMLRVTNYGPSNATGVVATDTLPSEVSIITVSPDCTVAGRVVLCTAGDLAADDSVLFDIAANVDPAASGPIINTARVSGNETDPLLPNTVEETTTIGVEADLAITKSAAPDPVAAGSPLTWTLQVMNLGPSTATGVVVADALPAGVSLVSASPDCAVAEEVVTCTAGDLAVGAGAEFTLEVTVDPAATGAITNTAAASGNEIDPAAGNDRAVATTAIVLAADLVLSQSDSADPVRPG